VNGSVVPMPPPPVTLATSLQLPDEANTLPDVTVNTEMENSNRTRTVLFFTTGTNSTFADRIKKDFYQEILTKTNHAAFRSSQEILTTC
jgi:hypothetical protein